MIFHGVVICLCLMANGVQHLLTCLLSICIVSFESSTFSSIVIINWVVYCLDVQFLEFFVYSSY